MLQTHDWQLDLGPYTGQAGELKTLSAVPQVFYRVENLTATDNSPTPGLGTRITKMIVGNKLQRPIAQGSTLVQFLGPGPSEVEDHISWDGCPPGSTISVEVSFVVACTFDLTFFGRAVG
jgi:hypothetical protein